MFGKSVVLRSAGLLSAAELGCLVREEDMGRKESFQAEWKDLLLSTRPEKGCSWREVNDQHKETFWQQQETRIVVQRSPWQVLWLGRLGEPLAQYHLPYQRVLPLPIFTPTDLSAKAKRMATPPQLRNMLDFEEALARGTQANGLCPNKTGVAEITKELPPVIQPSRPSFGKDGLPRSLSRSMSQDAQRG
ncbi:post-GPI attachment to proteins factor 3 isoform X7 [Alligator mississippiensis]|uniref:post-GPI attachment to proteins factor 3 isoform X7 n=1 Tax=Alligator mississippiensis TaxID=8496 RepID=UPI0003D0ECF5|nr:post-GPI attachment to proteins factor 3 isoform X7 [Alligator mississippiensis]